MRDIHLHIDRDRAAFAHETATLLERDVLFAQQFTMSFDYDATVLHECMCHEPGARPSGIASEFFWQTPGHVMVGMGHVGQIATLGSFAQLHAQLDAWRSVCVDRQTSRLLRAVGGLSFDSARDTSSSPMWRGFGEGKFWLPRCVMSEKRGQHWTLTLCTLVSPALTLEQFHAHLRREANLAEAWTSGAQRHEVSRESSALGLSIKAPGARSWGEQVAHASAHMRASDLDKVVLARRIEVEFDRRVRPATVLGALLEMHPTCTTFLVRPEPAPRSETCARFVGASPECLVRMASGKLYVDALAGSAPVEQPDEQLLQSAKDRQEHLLVVQEIAHRLAPFASVQVGEIEVEHLTNIKHLRTPVSGDVNPDAGLTLLAGALHPTPAVCGKPRALALDYLREHEYGTFLERGWYTGVVGWAGLDDRDGEFYVALRCALLEWQRATLFVGAGIMPDSEPEAELAETYNKARAVLDALRGIGEVTP